MRVTITVLSVLAALSLGPAAQTTWQPKNLQYFPRDIPRDELIQKMREFSFALGVRCQHCHTAELNPTFEGFDSDERPAKLKARAMLRMVDELNTRMLPQVPARAEPRVEVTCVTCHHGLPLPKSLQTTLLETIVRDGAAAAVAQYRQLRRDEMGSGRYDFGEWEMNELARRLAFSGRREAAVAMLEVNREFHPRSAEIDYQLGELTLALGAKEDALRYFRAALEKNPQSERTKRRIAEIERK